MVELLLLVLLGLSGVLLWRVERLGGRLAAREEEPARAARLEREWNEGVASILGYDQNRAKEAAGDDRAI